MSIATEIQRLQQAKTDLKNRISSYDVEIADTETIDVYAPKVDDVYNKGYEAGKADGGGGMTNIIRGFFTPEEDTTTFSVDGLPFTPKTLFLGSAELCTSNITRAFLQIMHTKEIGGCVSVTATTISLSASSWVKWSDYGVSYDSSASSTAALKNGLFKGGYTYEYLIIGEDAE